MPVVTYSAQCAEIRKELQFTPQHTLKLGLPGGRMTHQYFFYLRMVFWRLSWRWKKNHTSSSNLNPSSKKVRNIHGRFWFLCPPQPPPYPPIKTVINQSKFHPMHLPCNYITYKDVTTRETCRDSRPEHVAANARYIKLCSKFVIQTFVSVISQVTSMTCNMPGRHKSIALLFL